MRPGSRKTSNKYRTPSKPAEGSSSDDDDAASFQSPDDENATDYDFEYTTSRLSQLQTHPPKCSTRRQQSQQEEESTSGDDDDIDSENRPPTNRQSPRKNPTPKKATQRQANTSNPRTPQRQQRQPQQQQPQSQSQQRQTTTQRQQQLQKARAAAASKRKQTTPLHRLQRLNQEIRKLQDATNFLIPRLPFGRLAREIMMDRSGNDFLFSKAALEGLQCAAEMYITQRFQDAYLLTRFRGRVTLEVRDMALVAYFCRTYGNGYQM